MTTREELDARLAEFDRRRAVADAVLAAQRPIPQLPEPIRLGGLRARCTGRLHRWRRIRQSSGSV